MRFFSRSHDPEVQTFTTLSHPAETISGFSGSGENRTQLTHPSWPPLSSVYLRCPRVFHRRMVLSREPEIIYVLSAEKATERTSLVCPAWNFMVHSPLLRFQTRRVLSQDPERA